MLARFYAADFLGIVSIHYLLDTIRLLTYVCNRQMNNTPTITALGFRFANSFIAEGRFKGNQDFLKALRTLNEPFLISRLQLQNLNVDSPNPFLSIELELIQVIGDEQS